MKWKKTRHRKKQKKNKNKIRKKKEPTVAPMALVIIKRTGLLQ